MAAYFSRTLFRRNLTRFWPLAAACLIVSFFVFIVPEAGSSRYIYWYPNYVKNIMSSLTVFCAVFVPIMSILSAIAVYGYLHNPRASGFVSSLPVTRLGLYITNWLSGLTLMLAPMLLVGVLYGFVLMGQPVPSGDYFRWMGALVLSNLLFFSMAAFCTFLTGSPVMQAFLFALINFVSIAIYAIVAFVASRLVYGFPDAFINPSESLVMWLTPTFAIGTMIESLSPHSTYIEFSILPWLGYLVFAAAVAVFGYHMYRCRRIESAGDIIVHKPIRSVFKYVVGLLLGVFLGFMVTEFMGGGRGLSMPAFAVWLTISTVFFGSLGCLFSEMLIQKRLRVWKTAWKGILIYGAAIVAIVLFIRLDGTGYERRVPDPGDVTAVTITRWRNRYDVLIYGEQEGRYYSRGGNNWSLSWEYTEYRREHGLPIFTNDIIEEAKLRTPEYFETPDAIGAAVRLHQSIIGDKRRLESSMWNRSSWTYQLTYKMKDGSIINREYTLSFSERPLLESTASFLTLINHPEAVGKRNRFLTLPDSALQGIAITSSAYWGYEDYLSSSSALSPSRLRSGAVSVAEDEMPILMDALRNDAAAGTIGYVNLSDLPITYSYLYPQERMDTLLIELVYEPVRLGIPWAFEPDVLYTDFDEFASYEGRKTIVGFRVAITIDERCVNTVRALREIRFLEG